MQLSPRFKSVSALVESDNQSCWAFRNLSKQIMQLSTENHKLHIVSNVVHLVICEHLISNGVRCSFRQTHDFSSVRFLQCNIGLQLP